MTYLFIVFIFYRTHIPRRDNSSTNLSQYIFHYCRNNTVSRSQTFLITSIIVVHYYYNIHTYILIYYHWQFVGHIYGRFGVKKIHQTVLVSFSFRPIQVTRQNITIFFESLQYNPYCVVIVNNHVLRSYTFAVSLYCFCKKQKKNHFSKTPFPY